MVKGTTGDVENHPHGQFKKRDAISPLLPREESNLNNGGKFPLRSSNRHLTGGGVAGDKAPDGDLGKENIPPQNGPNHLEADDYEEEISLDEPDKEAYLTRDGIPEKQLRPPTSDLLIPVMSYDPKFPRLVLWDAALRREQAVREVVIHPVKDLEYYKLRNCITCVQRDIQLKQESAIDQFEPDLQEYLVEDLVDGLQRLVAKVRSFHQEHMCVNSFINLYLNNHFGNLHYQNFDAEKTQEELYKFSRLEICYAETMKCMEQFYSADILNGFWRNAGLTSVFSVPQVDPPSLKLKSIKASVNQQAKASARNRVKAAVVEGSGRERAEAIDLGKAAAEAASAEIQSEIKPEVFKRAKAAASKVFMKHIFPGSYRNESDESDESDDDLRPSSDEQISSSDDEVNREILQV